MHREVFPVWCQPPTDGPALRPEGIDVWRIRLAVSGPNGAASLAAPRHPVTTTAAGQRAYAHSAMRAILSRYTGCPADELQIEVYPGGKPYLNASGQQLEFNLSHSRDMALLAVADSSAVGIDVESYREIAEPLRIARRSLSDQECAELASVADEHRMDRFLDLWTRMEARQKAMGRGIFAQPADPALLSNFSFRPGPRQYAGLSVSPAISNPDLLFFDYGEP